MQFSKSKSYIIIFIVLAVVCMLTAIFIFASKLVPEKNMPLQKSQNSSYKKQRLAIQKDKHHLLIHSSVKTTQTIMLVPKKSEHIGIYNYTHEKNLTSSRAEAFPKISVAGKDRLYKFITLGVSYLENSLSCTSTVPTSSDTPADIYQVTNHSKIMAGLLGIGVGIIKPNIWFSQWQFGFLYQFISGYEQEGKIKVYNWRWNYRYHDKITSNSLFIQAATLIRQLRRFSIWINAGVGVSRNLASNYQEEPNVDVNLPRKSLSFSKHSQNQLAYHYGIDFAYNFSSHLSLALGLSREVLGQAKLGSGPIRMGVAGPSTKLAYDQYSIKLNYQIG